MFALFKPWTEKAIRVLLIAVIVFNALIPTAAIAMPLAEEKEVSSDSVLPSPTFGTVGTRGQFLSSSIRSLSLLQENTPFPETPTPVITETLTPEPTLTATSTPEATATPPVTETTTPTASPTGTMSQTPEVTPSPSTTSTPIGTSTTPIAPSTLSLGFSAAPYQIKTADQVTFKLKIVNQGQMPAAGLQFTNILPGEFNFLAGRNKGFEFDAQTRKLTWLADQATILLPGESLTLEYTLLVVAAKAEDVQIIDTAHLSAAGFTEPVAVETTLILARPDSSFTTMDSKGGEANGLNGRLKLKFPKDALDTSRLLSVRDLTKDASDPTTGEPWLKFELGLRAPKENNAAPTTSVTEESTLEGTSTDPVPQENDQVIPLEFIEVPFNQPVELTLSFDGLLDLAELTGEMVPFLVTLDEASGTWVRVPLKKIEREANLITAELSHFSVWGVGIGTSVPQNGASIMLYDKGYSGLFTGRSDYSLPIWTPPGRNGMGPSLALSYSSGIADGILGDVQAPWVGMGWNIDTVEIVRKITNGGCNPCGGGSYGYENRFLLLFNGIAMELYQSPTTPNRYHTKEESFLYIQRNNDALGNPSTVNATGEWWTVVEKDGTRWRLGYTAGAEQLAAMSGYPGTNPPTGAWATLGYAGNDANRVALRWRVDQVTDVYGNYMGLTYFEESRTVGSVTYDRASYIDSIAYTEHTSGTPDNGYSVLFVRENRGTDEVPTTTTNWDNWDTKRLDRVEVKYGNTVVRKYDLSYVVGSYADGTPQVSWQTTKLTSVAVSGSVALTPLANAPTITFTYEDKENRAPNGSGSNEWHYPRLKDVNNGWGSTATYTYDDDNRPYTSWYNWRVTQFDVTDSVNTHPKRITYAYTTAVYDAEGELVGYPQTTETIWDYSLNTFAKTVHKFFTNSWDPVGREYETLYQNATGTITRRKTLSNWVAFWANGYPDDVSFYYAASVEEYILNSTLDLVKETQYDYDPYTGNLLQVQEYNGSSVLYRQTDYEYVTNTSSSVWILETLARRTLKDAGGAVLSKQEYGYNGNLPGVGSPTLSKPDLSRVVSGMQTIDTKYVYDSYGNVTETRLFKNHGSTSSQPSGAFLTYTTDYDALETYVVSSDPPLIPATTTGYDFGLGLPTTVTDPNGNTTITTYDGLGRVLTVKYPGYAVANIKYTYPTPTGSPLAVSSPANNKVKTEKLDEDAGSNAYRTSWQFMDDLGRVIQTQSESEKSGSGKVIFTDTTYNVLDQVSFSDAPQESDGTLGTYSAPNWNSIPHNETTYDELGRVKSVEYPDATTDAFDYPGLRTVIIDRNRHKKVQENDAFGRLIKVEEYTGNSSSTYTLYATTNYAYDPRDLLTNITDAESNPTTIFYDGFGRKIQMIDPDLGDWRYRYDVFGNVTAQIDARNRALNMYYDDLNRLKGTTKNSDVDPDTYQPPADPDYPGYSDKYYYDAGTNGLGHRTSMKNGNSTTTWTYNALGQAETETHKIDGITYPTITIDFDWMNRPLTQTIPRSQGSTETITYDYTVMQLLSSLKGTGNYAYVSQAHHDATGQVKDQLLGNGLLQQTCYDSNRRKTVLRVFPNPGSIPACENTPANLRLNLLYTHQSNGNVSQVLDSLRNETLNYTYDDLDRLTRVNGSYNRTFDYDTIGNITSRDTGVTYTNPGTTGLAAWWTMDEKNGIRKDSHVNHYDLTDNNTVDWALGAQGRAASFVTANQERLTITDKPGLSGGDTDFTLIAHVYLNNNTGTFVIMDKSDNVNAYDYRLTHVSGTGFRFRVGSGSAYVDSGVVDANVWHTVIAWHDSVSNTINIQVDNETPDTLSFSSGTTDSTQPLSIGAFPSGVTGLDGLIDEVAIYRRVLTANERAWVSTRRTYADLTAPPLGPAIGYDYDDPDHIHAVTSLETGELYDYDANGNMKSRTEGGSTYTQTFDIHNRLSTVTVGGQTTEFLYDPDGNLVTKVNHDGSKTIYVGGIYEEDKTSGGTVTGTKTYYPAAGAMRVGSTLYYVLKDHLGSASVLTDASGAPVTDADVRYFPFGEARPSNINVGTAPMLTDNLFTGQRLIADLGIYHYGARFYSPKLGRFLSPDTTAPNLDNPQKLNHYSYVLNNPLRYSDPTGNRECDYDCQVEYYGADPDYEHYCEACEWDVAEQRRNEEIAETILVGGTQTVLSIAAPPVGLFFQTINGEPVSGWDLAFAALPAGGVGDDIGRGIVAHGDDAVALTGQWHHLLSNKIMRALDRHEVLSGVLRRDDLLVQARDLASHRGYQRWHRTYDEDVIRWLGSNEGRSASARQFLEFLQNVHLSPNLQHRFPTAVEVITNFLETIP